MATFTTLLKTAIELTGGSTELENMSFKGAQMGTISKLIGGDIGVQYMPIFDEEYRNILTGKIIDRFYNREIGFETIDIFQMKMRVTLNEIMPFYNQLYKSTQIPYEALSTINLKSESVNKTTGTENSTGNSNTEATNENASRAVNSTTPQTMLAGNEDYASSAADANSAGKNASNSESSAISTSDAEATGDSLVTGYQGTPADLIMRYRDSLINIDMMILRDLESLFFQLLDTSDSYAKGTPYYGYF